MLLSSDVPRDMRACGWILQHIRFNRWFLNGLQSSVKHVLTTTATVAVLNDIDSCDEAEIIKLSLTVTQGNQAGSGHAAAVSTGGRCDSRSHP